MPANVAKVFEIERAGKTLIIIPPSNLSPTQQLDVEASEILKMLDQVPGTSVILDCRHMDFFGSITLGFFMQLWLRVRVRNGRMAFCNLSDQMREVLRLTKTDTLWSVSSTRDEALEFFREAE